jgi:hypothetical protein
MLKTLGTVALQSVRTIIYTFAISYLALSIHESRHTP